ncbi:MAG: RnfABCDGE type electron transport complex subunit B [Tatlockia sp.]|jgi:electron transport complex protein RnfB
MACVQTIDALLPQTQCGECGFNGCLPYAKAMSEGLAPIDRCPPGGVATVNALGKLLGIDSSPYLPAAQKNTRKPALASIREAECIGCTKCITACPVDAIIGSGKVMHAILATECTGCGLCVEPCPVDCIELVELENPEYDKGQARLRFNAKTARLLAEEEKKQQQYQEKRQLAKHAADIAAKQDYILQALARVQAKKKSGT